MGAGGGGEAKLYKKLEKRLWGAEPHTWSCKLERGVGEVGKREVKLGIMAQPQIWRVSLILSLYIGFGSSQLHLSNKSGRGKIMA